MKEVLYVPHRIGKECGMYRLRRSFSYDLIADAYEKALQGDCTDITDDAMVVEKYGNHPVKLYEGSYENIKLTTPEESASGGNFYGKKRLCFR